MGPILCWKLAGQLPSKEDLSRLSPAIKALHGQWKALENQEGVLYCHLQDPVNDRHRWQLVVPQSLHPEVLRAVHGGPGIGHFGSFKMLARLRERFYWGRCRADIKTHCQLTVSHLQLICFCFF